MPQVVNKYIETHDMIKVDKVKRSIVELYLEDFENIVSQIFRSSGHSLYYYTFPAREDLKKYYEIDFLLTHGDKLIHVKVKSSDYKTHKSLDAFCDKFSSRILYPAIIYTKPLSQEGYLHLLPFYLAPFL